MKLLYNLFDFEREETAGERLFYRLFEVVVLGWTLNFMWTWGLYIPKIGGVILPLGLAEYVDVSFMFGNALPLVNAALVSLLLLLGFFRLSRYAYFIAVFFFHLQYVARYCLGEISHGSNIIGMALLGMGLASLMFLTPAHVRRFALGFCYFFFGLGYTSAAVCKLIARGPLWADGRHLWLWIGERTVDTFSITGSIDYNLVQDVILGSHWVATAILLFGLATELFGFLVWFKRTRTPMFVLLIVMHVGILLSMKINFPANVYMLVLLAYPWGRLLDNVLQKMNSATFEGVKWRHLKRT